MARKKQPETLASDLAARMWALFPGNQRSSGRWDPKNGKAFTEYRGPTIEDFVRHVGGIMGVGAVPILDDDKCAWAALDIDNHDQEDDIPIVPIDKKIAELKLPLIACRSKSGGVHVYLFLETPQPSSKVRSVMNHWSQELGYAGCEIFPKQARLATSKKEGKDVKQLGNWINLPYFAGNETVRYAVKDGQKLSLVEFLTAAEKGRLTPQQLSGFVTGTHADAPPCIQKMFQTGVASGMRNEALYAITVYMRKVSPDDVVPRALAAGNSIFHRPLPRAEAERTINSAARPDYQYRCGEDPCRSLCDRDLCVTRKYGIGKDEYDLMQTMGVLPQFTELRKFNTDPTRWELVVDGQRLANIATEDLFEFRRVRHRVAEKLNKVVPMIKPPEWERILRPLVENAVHVDTPDDASVSGVIRQRLLDFASKTELNKENTTPKERLQLLRGLPVIIQKDGERCVAFRGPDFVAFLKRTKTEELKGINLWFAVLEVGVAHTKLRVGDQSINAWYLPVEEVLKAKVEPDEPDFNPGL